MLSGKRRKHQPFEWPLVRRASPLKSKLAAAESAMLVDKGKEFALSHRT